MPSGRQKPRIRNSVKKYKKPSPKQKEKSRLLKHIYNTKTWKSIRNEYISLHPICELCNEKTAESVHHVIPFSQGRNSEEIQQLAYDKTNLKALCQTCHFKFHQVKNSKPTKN